MISQSLSERYLPWIIGAALTGGAVFLYPGRDQVLLGLMLFLPFLDRRWRPLPLPRNRSHYLALVCLLLAGCALLVWRSSHMAFALSTLFLAALPEEWFFRGYLMTRLGKGLPANLAASILFSLIHGLTQNWITALLVFAPSLFYGWLYQRSRDLPLLILTHALSNLIFVLFLAQPVATWLGNLM